MPSPPHAHCRPGWRRPAAATRPPRPGRRPRGYGPANEYHGRQGGARADSRIGSGARRRRASRRHAASSLVSCAVGGWIFISRRPPCGRSRTNTLGPFPLPPFLLERRCASPAAPARPGMAPPPSSQNAVPAAGALPLAIDFAWAARLPGTCARTCTGSRACCGQPAGARARAHMPCP